MDNAAIDKARIVYYGFFASLFAFKIDEFHFEYILKSIDILSRNPIDEVTAKALSNMKRKLKNGGYMRLKTESDMVFYNPTTSFVPMTASYYGEQRDGGKKRVEMMEYVFESNFRRNNDEYREHEDHIEFTLLFIQKLINEELRGDEPSKLLLRKVFANVLNEMIDEFSDNLMSHEKSDIYQHAALALKSFVDLERLYLNISQPLKRQQNPAAKPNIIKDKHQVNTHDKVPYAGCV